MPMDLDDFKRCIEHAGTPEGTRRVRAALAKAPFPHFDPVPGSPRLLVRIDADGTKTLGRFKGRRFVPQVQSSLRACPALQRVRDLVARMIHGIS